MVVSTLGSSITVVEQTEYIHDTLDIRCFDTSTVLRHEVRGYMQSSAR